MKRLTTLLFVLLIAFAGFGQRVLQYGDKVLTYNNKVLYIQVPPDEVNGLEFWFDGKDLATVSLNVDKVIQWDDKSGFDRHISNAVDAQRPTYSVATGRVTFVSANSTYLKSSAFGSALSQPNTIFIVCKIIGVLSDTEAILDDIIDSRHIIYIVASKFRMYAGVILNDGTTNANDNIHCTEFNGATSNYWINGINVATGNVGNNNFTGLSLGAGGGGVRRWIDAEIMEVFGYNRSLSEKERTLLTNYLQDKWDLSLWLIILLIPNIRRKFKIAA